MNEAKQKKQEGNIELFLNAFEQLNNGGQVTVKELSESGLMAGKTAGSLRVIIPKWIKNSKLEGFEYERGVIKKISANT